MDFKTMLQLPVLDTNEVINILQDIADIERKADRPQMPKVTICTHRDSASGFFVNYDAEKKVVLLCDMYDREAQFQYIEVHAISSISFSNINKYGYLLSDGTIQFTPDASEIPTMLQLKKEIKTLELEVKEALNQDLSIVFVYDETPEDLDKYYASKALLLLKDTLLKIATDNLAKTAFTDSISTIRFSLGNENTLDLDKDMLTMTIDTTKGLKHFPKPTQLQDHIEKFL